MAPLCWKAVTLTLTLSAGISWAVVDQNQLEYIVKDIFDRYRPSYQDNQGAEKYPMFSVAISIPYNEDKKMYDSSQVSDPETTVKETILDCKVYSSSSMVAATVLKWPDVLQQCPSELVQWPDVLRRCGQTRMTWQQVKEKCNNEVREGRADHAEYRTLQHFDSLKKKSEKDLMLFYVMASPCDQKCTNPLNTSNILEKIKVIKKWANYAVVFSIVFREIPPDNQKESVQRLGESVGLENIYRCKKERGRMQCESCSKDSEVAPNCWPNN